jgi:RNA polymerase sigma-70 factor (ECF subfamily)
VRPDSHAATVLTGDVTALVARARQGEAEAFRVLFRLHVQRVSRIVHRMASPGADVDDMVQVVFVEAFRALPAFRGDAMFSTWLARITVRVTMRAIKRPRLSVVPLEDAAEPSAPGPGPEGIVSARETLARLDALLGALRPKRRVAFVLHVLEGYSMEEIAAIVNASVAAVKVRIHDARCEIERRLRKDPELLAAWGRGGAS